VIFVVGLQIFSGNSGILSFGHTAFIGTGAYVAGILTVDPALKSSIAPALPGFLEHHRFGFVEATLIAVGVVALVALPTGVLVARLDGASAVIAILSLLLISFAVFSGWTGVTGGQGGAYGFGQTTTLAWAFGAAAVVVFLARLFKESSTGLQLRGSREDSSSAASVGVRVRQYRFRAWVLSATVSGAGGALFALALGAITPSTFYLPRMFTIVVMLIVGGMTTVTGAVVGAGVVTLVSEVLKPYENDSLNVAFVHFGRLTGLTQIALAIMILVVMYFRREGLVGRREVDEWLPVLRRRLL
jgi:branched-chain amino acid transport system permease protein